MAVVPGTFTWRSVASTVKVTPVGALRERNDSAVLLADGRVLYVYNSGGAVWQGYAPSVAAFITTNGSVVDTTQVIATANASPCISKVGSRLLMAVMHMPSATQYRVDLYESPSGVGGDWVFVTNIQTHNDSGATFWNAHKATERFCGEIFVTSAGRWILPAGWFRNYGGAQYGATVTPAIWTSDNAGATWTLRLTAPGSEGYDTAGINRNIAYFDGALWTSSSSTAAGRSGQIYKSSDGGASWPLVYQGDDLRARYACFGVTDASSLYVAHINGSARGGLVEQVTQMEPFFTNWTQIRDYTDTGFQGSPIVQRLGDEIVYMHNGTVLGVGTLAPQGWVIGRIPMF